MLDFTRFERGLNSLTNSTKIDIFLKNESIHLDRLNSPYFSHKEMTIKFDGHMLNKSIIISNNNYKLYITINNIDISNVVYSDKVKTTDWALLFSRLFDYYPHYFKYRLFLINSLLDRLQPIKRLLPDWLFNSNRVATFVWDFKEVTDKEGYVYYPIQQKIEAETEEE